MSKDVLKMPLYNKSVKVNQTNMYSTNFDAHTLSSRRLYDSECGSICVQL